MSHMASKLGVPTSGPEFESKMRGISPLHNGQYWSTIGTRRGIVKVLRALEEWPEWGSNGIRAKCRRGHRVNATPEHVRRAIAGVERSGQSGLYL
jgi:hypothetical protein